MQKYFNTSGPCWPDKHYMLPTTERCEGLLPLIARQQYFIIHAARQTGKTTLLMDLMQQLNQSGDYYALYCSLEVADKIVTPQEGIPAIVKRLRAQMRFHPSLKTSSFAEQADFSNFTSVLQEELSYLCQNLDKPLVILFDEVDCLSNGTLISFLRQLRDGYINRGHIPFVHAIALVGMRNIRDYKSRVREGRETLGSSSPFNIAKVSKTIRNFNQEEVARLYAQHTAQTGQPFAELVIKAVYHYTQGQPWLVNAIADEIVERILEQDFSQPITVDHVEQAVEVLIKRRDVHLDSLLERLKEERVRRFVEPVVIGQTAEYETLDDDYQYVLDLGLLREEDRRLQPANPIYGEVMVRVLSSQAQHTMEQRRYPPKAAAYLMDGTLDMQRLLTDFQQFWRENSEIWQDKYQYKEAAPHLVLQAFLQRVINAGGRIIREMASGTGRLDLCVQYGDHRYPLELKVRHQEKIYEAGKAQLARYLEKMGCAEGWLIVFDKRKTVSWDEKLFWQTAEVEGKTIHTVGC